MFKKTKLSKDFPTILFVAASIISLLLTAALITFLKLELRPGGKNKHKNAENRLYLKDNFNQADPLMTKVPKFNDVLTGPIISSADPSIGADKAKVTLVQFSDFECKFCKSQVDLLKSILKDYGDKVRLIHKDYPEARPLALTWQAAIAARCADDQGKYWEYHDKLYQDNNALSPAVFNKIANELELNINQFDKCSNDPYTSKLIKDNIEEANALNIVGIPFLYINDKEIMGAASKEEIKTIIDKEISKD